MTKYIIKETIIREENHPSFINEWFSGKEGWCGEATLPEKYVAREHGFAFRKWAERRIEEKKLSDIRLHELYPNVSYTKNYEILEVTI